MRYPWNRNTGGSNDPKNQSLTERSHSQQKIETGHTNKSIGKHHDPSHQVPGRFHQPPRSHQKPHRPSSSAGPAKEGSFIFDKWVEFRDKYIAGNVDSGFRKLGYTGKFIANKVLNSKTAHDLKDKAIQEGMNLKDKIIEEGSSLKDRLKFFSKEKFSSGKDVAKEKLEHSSSALKEKLLLGKDVVKEKAQEGLDVGKDVLKEKLSQGKDVAKEKLGQGGHILKEKLGQGSEVLKEVMKEQMQKGSGGIRDKVDQGSHILKDKVIQGKDSLKEVVKEQMQKGSGGLRDKYEQGSSVVKDKIVDASKTPIKNMSDAASNVYESVTSAPQAVSRKVTRFSRRAGLYVFFGVTSVAFAVALGNKLPQAYFDYQLKKEALVNQQQQQGENRQKSPEN